MRPARSRPACSPIRRCSASGCVRPGVVGDRAREHQRRGRRRGRLAGHDRSPRRLAAGRRCDGSGRGRGARGGRGAAAGDADRRRRRAARATPRATWCSRRARARGASRTGRTSSARAWPSASARLLSHPGIVRGSTRGPARSRRALPLPRLHRRARAAGALARRRGALPLPPRQARDQRRRDRRADLGRRPAAVRDARPRREPRRRRVGPADRRRPVADRGSGALRPASTGRRPGDYAVSVDSARRRGGAFRLRFWVNDVTPPALGRLRVSGDARTLRVPVTDAGSGVDPRYLECALVRAGLVDRQRLPARLGRRARASRRSHVGRLAAGPLCARRARRATTRSRATRSRSRSARSTCARA